MKKYLLSLFVVSTFTAFTFAQDAEESSESEVEEVVVKGIKSSLKDAIDIKRSNVGVMEAITAEDFGKFPDGNLAESLARIAGVGIDRSNVEGERVAVRGFGPEFNLVTLNGRQMPTVPGYWGGGRSFNFGDIASVGVAAVELYKSTNSSLPSGGIGSTINMVTTKPLNVDGTVKHLGFAIVDDTTNPAGSNLALNGSDTETQVLYATNKGNWGFSVSGVIQERNNRETGTRENNWIIYPYIIAADGYDRLVDDLPAPILTLVDDNNARTDGVYFIPEPAAYQFKDNNRIRKNAQVTFQWAFNDNVTSTLDYTYSAVDFSSEGQMFGSWLGGWNTTSGTVNERGTFTDIVVENRVYDHQYIWGGTESANKSLGFNLEWAVNDSLTLTFDAHDSTAQKTGTEIPNEMGFTQAAEFQQSIAVTNSGNSGVTTFEYLGDEEFLPENYFATSAVVRNQIKDNRIVQYQLNGEWVNQNDGLIASVDFGVSTIDNKYGDLRAEYVNAAPGADASSYPDRIFSRETLDGFMNNFDPDFGTGYYYAIDGKGAVSALEGAIGAPLTAGDWDTNDRVTETLDSAFIQFNLETEINSMPLNVVVGLRYEESESTSKVLSATPNVMIWDFLEGVIPFSTTGAISDYAETASTDELLPNIAMSLGIDDDQVIRFSYGKSMARPSLPDLRAGKNFSSRDTFTVTAASGDPGLNPMLSTNIDLSYENYYAEGSYFAINFFRKEIEDFIYGNKTSTYTVPGLTNPVENAEAVYGLQCMEDWILAGRPGDVFGDEHCISQQLLWAQGWTNDYQKALWTALILSSNGWSELPANTVDENVICNWTGTECDWDFSAVNGNCVNDGGWWRCNPGYIVGDPGNNLMPIELTTPGNLGEGEVDGIEVTLQHLFEGTPYGMQFNATVVNGGDVDIDRDLVLPAGERQFILPGLGDSGNFSVFYEDDKHTLRLALNYRGETVAGFGNYDQPLYVEERYHVDAGYQYRVNDTTTIFVDMMNITDEETRLHARYEDMLFLSQDHGPVYKVGFRVNF